MEEYHAVPERFPCFRCGACCLDVTNIPDISEWADSNGTCRYYSSDGCTCQIYDSRPAVCDVWRTYRNHYEKEGVSWDDFVYTNMLNCCLLRYLNDIPEPEESPFYGKQEDIAAALLQDMESPRLAVPDSYENEPRIGKFAQLGDAQRRKTPRKVSEPVKKEASKTPKTLVSLDLNGPIDLDVPDVGQLDSQKAGIPSRKPNKHRGELLD